MSERIGEVSHFEGMRDERKTSFFSSLIPSYFLPFVAQLFNRLEHLLARHLGWIVTNVQQVFFQIDVNLFDA